MKHLLAALLLASPAVAAPPAVTSLFPAGGQAGTAVDVTATGTFEQWPVEAWATPGVTVKSAKDKGRLAVTVAADAKPGVAWLRLFDGTGVSGLRPFVVGVLPEVGEKEPNDEAVRPQAVEKSCVVNGKLAKNDDVDCYAVTLTKGQTLVASLTAHHTLRSPMDAVLQVVSADGFVLDQNHDFHGLDPQLAFTAPAAGTFVVRTFAFPAEPNSTIRFFGSEACVYRLTLTTAGFADFLLPLAVTGGMKTRPVGWNLDAKPLVPSGIESRAEDHPCFDFTATPSDTPLTPPVTLTGLVKEANGGNTFAVKVAKGKPVTFQVESRKLDLPLTPVLRVRDGAGTVLTRAEPAGPAADCEATVVPTKDETLRVEVRDLFGHGGPRYAYRLRMTTGEPDVTATVATDRFAVTPGTPLDVPLKFSSKMALPAADLKLKADGLPAGVTATLVADKEPKVRFTAEGGAVSTPIRLTLGTKIARPVVATVAGFDTTTADLWLTVGPNATAAPPPAKTKK